MGELFSSFLSSGYFISWLGPCGVSDWTERILWVFWRGLSFYRECQETVHQMLPVARTALNNMWEKITLLRFVTAAESAERQRTRNWRFLFFYLLLWSESIWFLYLFTIIIIFSIYFLDFVVNISIFILWSNAAQSLGYLNSAPCATSVPLHPEVPRIQTDIPVVWYQPDLWGSDVKTWLFSSIYLNLSVAFTSYWPGQKEQLCLYVSGGRNLTEGFLMEGRGPGGGGQAEEEGAF